MSYGSKTEYCLNPYFNGIYFLIVVRYYSMKQYIDSLNPYFNGIYFLIWTGVPSAIISRKVLILILMEYTF